MKKPFGFIISRKKTSPPFPWYDGEFHYETKTLKIWEHTGRRDPAGGRGVMGGETILVNNPDEIFYNNATFDDILCALYLPRHLGYVATSELDTLAGLDDLHRLPPYYTCMLIASNPFVLRDERVVEHLIKIIRFASDGTLSERKQYKKALENIIPRHYGGRVSEPLYIKHAKYLLEKLAAHLSKECRNTFPPLRKIELGKKKLLDSWDVPHKVLGNSTPYEYLLEAAKEPRISSLKAEELKQLYDNPKKYAKSILEKRIGKTLRTLQ